MDCSASSTKKDRAPASAPCRDAAVEASLNPSSSSKPVLEHEPISMSLGGEQALASPDLDPGKRKQQQQQQPTGGSGNGISPRSKPSSSVSRLSNRAGLDFLVGSKLEAKDFNEKWYSAKVVETDWVEREVLIHFEKWNSRYDEWIPMDSSRLRTLQLSPKDSKIKEFLTGERVLATWADGKKYPAKVKAALGSDKYDVLFDDGYSKILKSSKMTRIVDALVSQCRPDEQLQLQQQFQSDYVGSKQERRDKKRKHTVTELFHFKKKNKGDTEKVLKKQDSASFQNVKSVAKVEHAVGMTRAEPDAGIEIQHSIECAVPPEEDYATYIGDLRVEIEDSTYKCPIAGCNKNFRKENLLQMHIKHYHPEYSKFLGSTPNVADLAYARTIGESVEDLMPKKSRVATTQSTQTAYMSPSVSHATDTDSSQADVDNKLDNKLYTENNTSLTEDNSSEQSNSCTMSPGTLFDMRFKEERTYTGIKTLPPVRHVTALGTDDSEHSQYSNVSNDIQKLATPNDKPKPQKKRQHSESTNRSRKQKSIPEQEESYDHFDETILDGDDALDSSYKCTNISNNRSEIENTDSVQSQIDNIMIIDGEVIKVEKLRREEIINCTCGIIEEDGLMIQCDLCLCWQHGHCNGIEKEKDVPEKYVCYTCQHPYRLRLSKKYFHDQEWIREGKLPSINKYPLNVLKHNKRTATLKRTSDLVSALLQVKNLLHSLRVKINIAQNKDHPKLYIWAKSWSTVKIPEMKIEPVPILEVTKAEKSSDDHDGDTQEKLDFPFSIRTEPDQKSITTDTELMNILEDSAQTEAESKLSTKQSTTNNFKDEGRILLDALTKNGFDEEDQQVLPIEKEVIDHDSPTKLLSSSRSNITEKLNKSPLAAPQAGDRATNALQQPVIPEPEAPIDPVECKLRLLEHIDHFQNYVDSTLTFVEAQLTALEDVNSTEKPSDNSDIRIKQTIQMIMRDLETIRKLAALCS